MRCAAVQCHEGDIIDAGQREWDGIEVGQRAEHGAREQRLPAMLNGNGQRGDTSAEDKLGKRIHRSILRKTESRVHAQSAHRVEVAADSYSETNYEVRRWQGDGVAAQPGGQVI